MAAELAIPSEAYEQACLKAVRDALGKPTMDRLGVVVHGVELVRDGDDVRIVASVTRSGINDVVEWRLYRDAFSGIPPEGGAEPPEGVATQMLVWAAGG